MPAEKQLPSRNQSWISGVFTFTPRIRTKYATNTQRIRNYCCQTSQFCTPAKNNEWLWEVKICKIRFEQVVAATNDLLFQEQFWHPKSFLGSSFSSQPSKPQLWWMAECWHVHGKKLQKLQNAISTWNAKFFSSNVQTSRFAFLWVK